MDDLNALRDRYARATVEVELAMVEMDMLNAYAGELGWPREATSTRREQALMDLIEAHAALVTHRESDSRS